MPMLEISEGSHEAFLDRRTKVWLECNGEPYDFRSLCFEEFLDGAGKFELVSFKCPRCGARHQSLRFL